MSMQIEFDDDYNETTFYHGTVDEQWDFTVAVVYYSNIGNYDIQDITWNSEDLKPFKRNKAENKIRDIVMSWHKRRNN